MAEYQPPGWPTVIPRIFCGDAPGLVEFIKAVFDASGEYDRSVPAELRIGDSIVMVSGDEVRGAVPAFLYVYVPDADVTYERAVMRGAVTIEAPLRTPYGDRRATVQDPWDNVWQIATRLAG
ncbi:MAG TPA: VOC family protein [Pseudomonadales bacterium]